MTRADAQHHRFTNSWRFRGSWLLAIGVLVGCGSDSVLEHPRTSDSVASGLTTTTRFNVEDGEAIESRLLGSVSFLASDELEGRGPWSPGLDQAADYLGKAFRQIGLDVELFPGTGPYQEFRRRTNRIMGAGNSVEVVGDGSRESLVPLQDFGPLGESAPGRVEAPLAFAGFGITAPEYGYDDYQGVSVGGRVVIVLRHEPRLRDPLSEFQGQQLTRHSWLSEKVANAYRHGAVAIVFCTDRASLAGGVSPDPLIPFATNSRQSQNWPIPAVHCRRQLVERWLKRSAQVELDEIEGKLNEMQVPQSCLLSDTRLALKVDISEATQSLKNVIGVLPGCGGLENEYIVVGAHYDHLGLGGAGSLSPWTHEVHNGADDNASGTATLLEVARHLAARTPNRRRSIVFIAFSAEEMGLLGSQYYIRFPRFSLRQTVAMVNLDMVGRLTSNRLEIAGVGTAREFVPLVKQLASRYDFALSLDPDGYGPSDHASFYSAGIPVLHFFTGLHRDYHRPSDDTDRLNIPGMCQIARFVADTVASLAESPQRCQSILDDTWLVEELSPPTQRDYRNTRRLGIAADLTESPAGLRINRVSVGSPAAKADLRPGDIIVRAANQDTDSVDVLRRAIQAADPATGLSIELIRQGVRLEVNATFERESGPSQ